MLGHPCNCCSFAAQVPHQSVAPCSARAQAIGPASVSSPRSVSSPGDGRMARRALSTGALAPRGADRKQPAGGRVFCSGAPPKETAMAKQPPPFFRWPDGRARPPPTRTGTRTFLEGGHCSVVSAGRWLMSQPRMLAESEHVCVCVRARYGDRWCTVRAPNARSMLLDIGFLVNVPRVCASRAPSSRATRRRRFRASQHSSRKPQLCARAPTVRQPGDVTSRAFVWGAFVSEISPAARHPAPRPGSEQGARDALVARVVRQSPRPPHGLAATDEHLPSLGRPVHGAFGASRHKGQRSRGCATCGGRSLR